MSEVFELPSTGGTYALWLACRRTGAIRVGRRGVLRLRPGVYVYVGSAFGPGGLRARVGRHGRRSKTSRWHADYLTAHTTLEAVVYEEAAREHAWAHAIGAAPGAELPLPRFGASDCRCPSHLFHFADPEDARRALL